MADPADNNQAPVGGHPNRRVGISGTTRKWLNQARHHVEKFTASVPALNTTFPEGASTEDKIELVEHRKFNMANMLKKLTSKLEGIREKQDEWTKLISELDDDEQELRELEENLFGEHIDDQQYNDTLDEAERVVAKAESDIATLERQLARLQVAAQPVPAHHSPNHSRDSTPAPQVQLNPMIQPPRSNRQSPVAAQGLDGGVVALPGEAGAGTMPQAGGQGRVVPPVELARGLEDIPDMATATSAPERGVAATYLPETSGGRHAQLHPPRAPSAPIMSPAFAIEQYIPSLPKLELPTFRGDMLEFNGFWGRFKVEIHENPRLSDATKLAYLDNHLSGPPKELVHGHRVLGSYGAAVDALIKKYGNQRAIKRALYSELSRLDSKDFELFQIRLEKIVLQLEAAGEDLSHPVVLQQVEAVLPSFLISSMVRQKRDHPDWSLKDLRRFLAQTAEDRQEEREIRREAKTPAQADGQRAQQNFRHPPRGGGTTLAVDSQASARRSDGCVFCQEKHKSATCTRYPTYSERIERVKELGLCFRCLAKGHISRNCPSSVVCKLDSCSGHHYSFLCPTKRAKSSANPPIRNTVHFIDGEEEGHAAEEQVEGPEEQGIDTQVTCQVGDDGSRSITLLGTKSMEPQGQRYTALKIKEIRVKPLGRREHVCVVAVFDDGSSHSFIELALMKELKLAPIRVEKRAIGVFGSSERKLVDIPIVRVYIAFRGGGGKVLEVGAVPSITSSVMTVALDKFTIRMEKAAVIDLKVHGTTARMLIGNDYINEIIDYKSIKKLPSGFHKLETKVGQMISGSGMANLVGTTLSSTSECLLSGGVRLTEALTAATDKALEEQVLDLWRLEALGIKDSPHDNDDDIALGLFRKSMRLIPEPPGERYEVEFPKKENIGDMADDFGMAKCRLDTQVKSLAKKPGLLERYNRIIWEWHDIGHTEIVDLEADPDGPVKYLPHHPHVSTTKTTEMKVRPVVDASAKTKGGLSLNDVLYRGPPGIPDLAGVLLRVRTSEVLLSGDIEKAFLQIALAPESRDVTRFLWLKDLSKGVVKGNIVVFRFKRVPFGIVSSPFLLSGCLTHMLEQDGSWFAKLVLRDLYVDNAFVMCKTSQEAIAAYKKLKELFSKVKMNIRDFACNDLRVMQSIEEKDRESKPRLSVLGMQWDVSEDTLSLHLPSHTTFDSTWTKRKVLKFMGKIFDPLGLLAPVVLPLKFFLQKLWIEQLEWDEALTSELNREWLSLIQWGIQEYSSPRFVTSTSEKESELHVFCDASELGYGAVCLLRWREDSRFRSRIIFAKTRVAPKKPAKSEKKPKESATAAQPHPKATKEGEGTEGRMTIPDLELMGITVGSRLLEFCVEHLSFGGTTYLWTDSLINVGWLRNAEKSRRVFVTNRVREIRKRVGESTRVGHVAGVDNPADIASRGCTLEELVESGPKSRLWLEGPEWFALPEGEWPTKAEEWPAEESVTLVSLDLPPWLTRPEPMFMPLARYSTMGSLLRVTTYVLRFRKSILQRMISKGKLPPERSALSMQLMRVEVKEAQARPFVKKWFKKDAVISYKIASPSAEEWSTSRLFLLLRAQREHGSTTDLKRVKVTSDETGLLWCHHRLPAEDGGVLKKLYLPRQGPFTRLAAVLAHDQVNHSGTAYTMARLREWYWLPCAKQVINTVVRNCQGCAMWRSPPFRMPPMAPQTADRVSRHPPFSCVGLDYLGPVNVKFPGNHTSKVWIAVFTCYTTRLCHFEPVFDLSANGFLDALRRFVGQWGIGPQGMQITSDNAKQFALAAKTITTAEFYEDGRVVKYCAERGIRWRFIPAYSPEVGGVWERVVGMFKGVLRRAVGRQTIDLNMLLTLTRECQSILNMRPLTYQGPDDLVPFCPMDFIKPRSRLQLDLATEEFDDTYHPPRIESRESLLRYCADSNRMIDRVWNLFYRHYIQEFFDQNFNHRNPHSTTARSPQVGEVVIVRDANLPRNKWRLAKVVEIRPSRDEDVRNVRIQLSSRGGKPVFSLRSVRQLCPLEISRHPTNTGNRPDDELPPLDEDSSGESDEEGERGGDNPSEDQVLPSQAPPRRSARLIDKQRAKALADSAASKGNKPGGRAQAPDGARASSA